MLSLLTAGIWLVPYVVVLMSKWKAVERFDCKAAGLE